MNSVLPVSVPPSVRRVKMTIIPVEVKRGVKQKDEDTAERPMRLLNKHRMPAEEKGYIRPKKHDYF